MQWVPISTASTPARVAGVSAPHQRGFIFLSVTWTASYERALISRWHAKQ